MKKLLILLVLCLYSNSGYAEITSLEQFDREQKTYQQELYKKVREAGYDPTLKKSIAEQYKEKQLINQTIESRKRLQQEYEQEQKRALWYEQNGLTLIISIAVIAILIILSIIAFKQKKK